MTIASSFRLFFALIATLSATYSINTGTQSHNQTRYNPTIPGWHSDPSCVFVAERNNTTFCTSSTFLLTPGLPVRASKDLNDWKLASHALSRESQYLDFKNSLARTDDIWAATIRYHQGTFYKITIYRNNILEPHNTVIIFKTTDPYSDNARSDPVRSITAYIDPDIFWDKDGTAYVAIAGTYLQTADLKTDVFSEPCSIGNGTRGVFLKEPHIYRKDGYCYLIVNDGAQLRPVNILVADARMAYQDRRDWLGHRTTSS